MSRTLSAPRRSPVVVRRTLAPRADGGPPAGTAGTGGQDGPVLRMMRGPDGGPSRGLRLMALIVALALVGAAATALTPLLTWLLDLL